MAALGNSRRIHPQPQEHRPQLQACGCPCHACSQDGKTGNERQGDCLGF